VVERFFREAKSDSNRQFRGSGENRMNNKQPSSEPTQAEIAEGTAKARAAWSEQRQLKADAEFGYKKPWTVKTVRRGMPEPSVGE
jgi:hypothetical protein